MSSRKTHIPGLEHIGAAFDSNTTPSQQLEIPFSTTPIGTGSTTHSQGFPATNYKLEPYIWSHENTQVIPCCIFQRILVLVLPAFATCTANHSVPKNITATTWGTKYRWRHTVTNSPWIGNLARPNPAKSINAWTKSFGKDFLLPRPWPSYARRWARRSIQNLIRYGNE